MGQALLGSTAIITGASGGLGHAVTRALLEDGAHCVIAYGAHGSTDAIDAEFSGRGFSYSAEQVDVLDAGSVDALVNRALKARGRIDILAHLVGGYKGGQSVQKTPIDDWEQMIDLNLTSAFICFRAVLPTMLQQNYGRIIGVSSRSAVRATAGASAYTAAKAALLALIACIAEENHGSNITANAVLPGIIDTPANRTSMPGANVDNWAKPEEIADVVRFLASKQSALVSGAAIPVYGKS